MKKRKSMKLFFKKQVISNLNADAKSKIMGGTSHDKSEGGACPSSFYPTCETSRTDTDCGSLRTDCTHNTQ